MVVMTCPCLNVKVYGKGTSPILKDVTNVHLTENTSSDTFFAPNAFVVTLDLGGVVTSQTLLCKERAIDGWTVITCICCMFDIYAKFVDDQDRVLVNCNAEKDSEHISHLMESQRYSQLFKLVLPEINDNFIQNNFGIKIQNSNLDNSIEHVQNQVSNYLKDEQRAMEERIRKFTELQQVDYANLLQKVRKHKQAMVYLLLKSKDNQKSNQNEDKGELSITPHAAPLSKDLAIESSTSTDSAFDKNDVADPLQEKIVRKISGRPLRRTVSNPARPGNKKKAVKKSPSNIDVGGVFDMEEFDSKEEYSNEEYSDDSDHSNVEENTPENNMYATSLPMSIPAFSRYTHFSVIEDDDDTKVPLPKDHAEIAASFRALACSIHDSTEMFGELPRRRLNTGELLSSRPI